VILQKEKTAENVSSFGLILTTEDDSSKAKVIAVGQGRLLPNGKRAEMDVAIGDTVLYNKYAIQEIEHDGEDYMIIFTKDILAILGEE
jgi:chaperonin GroES